MGCNRDYNCYSIAKDVYPNLKKDIDESIKKTSTGINDIVDELSILTIPEDYLGTKVKEKVDEMKEFYSEDISELGSFNKAIDNFINEKIREHQGHYQEWKRQQELKKKEEEKKNTI